MSKTSAFDLVERSGGEGPLSGVKVLDLSGYIAGPFGGTLLADQGAAVIKIEPPNGDNLRRYPSTLAGENRAFLGLNRGKLGVVIDLKDAAQHALFLDLVAEADVLIQNYRPAVLPRLGIEYERLRAVNPRLIYCSVTGFGEEGPLRERAGYDQVLQTMTGMTWMQGRDAGEPQILYGSVVDYYAAALVAAGVASALFERERSGLGQFVGISLLRSALTMQSARLVWADSEPADVDRDMRSGGVTGIHPTKAGHIYISANTPHFWHALCTRTGLGELAQDPRYDSVRKRAVHADEILPRLRQALLARSAEEWEEIFGDEVPCAVARRPEAMFDNAQVQAESMTTHLEHPDVGGYRSLARPIKFGRTPGPDPFPAPRLGQDTAAVLGAVAGDASEDEGG